MQRFPLAAWEQSRSRLAARRLLEHDAAPTVDFARDDHAVFSSPGLAWWRSYSPGRPLDLS
jgi:hypothetical protein